MRSASFAPMFVSGIALLVACGGLADGSSPNGNGEVGAPDRDTTPAPTAAKAPGENAETIAAPEVVAEDVGVPSAIAVDDDRVYFTTRTTMQSGVMNDAGALFMAFKRPGSKALLLSTDLKSAHYEALALDGTHAYVATSDARLFRIPLAGGTEEAIADLPTPAIGLAVNAEHVVIATSAGIVERVPKDGTGAIEPVATIAGRPRAVTTDDAGSIYVATSVSEGEGGSIVKIAAGGEPSVLTTSGSSPCAMIREGDRLFFSTSSAVHRLALTGGPPATVTAGSFGACAIAADGPELFFATGALGLMRAPAMGGEPSAIAAGKHAVMTPGAVAVDAAHVYWLDGTSVLRVGKAR